MHHIAYSLEVEQSLQAACDVDRFTMTGGLRNDDQNRPNSSKVYMKR